MPNEKNMSMLRLELIHLISEEYRYRALTYSAVSPVTKLWLQKSGN